MGKKYVIELEDVPFVNDLTLLNERLYRVKGFKSLVFDENGLEKLTPIDDVLREAERKGQNEAWEFIRLSDEDLKEIFPEAYKEYGRDGIAYKSYYEAKTMYDEWSKNQPEEVTIGDEVSTPWNKGVVIYMEDDKVKVLSAGGDTFYIRMEDGKKTGRHFSDVADLLKKIK